MTASSSSTTPMETEPAANVATLEDELKNFRLQNYHTDRFPSFLQDLDTAGNSIGRAFGFVMDVAIEMEKYEEPDQVQSMKETIPEIIELERQIKTQKEIFKQLQQNIRTTPVSDVVEAYQKEWKRADAVQQIRASKKKYKEHDFYTEFRQTVWNVNHANEPLPAESDDDDDDDEIRVNSVTLALYCPLTTAYLEEPVTSRECKHTFSKKAIHQLLRMNRGRVACPITGCGKTVKMQDLYDDTLAERRVARMRSSMASQRQTQDFYDVE